MPQVEPRLHSEFFDELKKIEYILEQKSKVDWPVIRSILDPAVEAYVQKAHRPFHVYLQEELCRHPAIYCTLSDEALEELFNSKEACAQRAEWRSSLVQVKCYGPSFKEFVDKIQK